ncbi:MAG: NAD-dependent epimerase/dehydratase family protein [Myxococcales bacterium]|nr:NAD-dependent epimerase/dehydratase family protein [Myxococcales bacterium]
MLNVENPVAVTGANGYVASQLVRALLLEGFTVHGTVRNPRDERKLAHLRQMSDANGGRLRLFAADLSTSSGFDDAFERCSVVFHTASPFTTGTPEDPEASLVTPAVQGTRNVLEAVNRANDVRRVVLTSSCAAIYGDARDMTDRGLSVFTEEHWNESSSLTREPYSYSKTLAERAAWEAAKAQDRWSLVAVNPAFIIGPGVGAHAESTSNQVIQQLADGTNALGVPDLRLATVDVRDVAFAHVEAARRPGASGRYILTEGTHSLKEMADALRARFGSKLDLPQRVLPKFLVWLVGPSRGIERGFISRNVGFDFRFDTSKARRELGVQFRPLAESLVDHVEQLIETGRVAPAGSPGRTPRSAS